MRKLLLVMLFFAGTTITIAQEDRQENDQDKIQQETPRPAQLNLERTSRIEAQSTKEEKIAKRGAKKLAKANAKQATASPDTLKKR